MTIGPKTRTIENDDITPKKKIEVVRKAEIVGYICEICHRTYMALGWRRTETSEPEPVVEPKAQKPGYCLHIFFIERIEEGDNVKAQIFSIVRKIRKLKDAVQVVKELFPHSEISKPKKQRLNGDYWASMDSPTVWIKIHKETEPCPPGWSQDVKTKDPETTNETSHSEQTNKVFTKMHEDTNKYVEIGKEVRRDAKEAAKGESA